MFFVLFILRTPFDCDVSKNKVPLDISLYLGRGHVYWGIYWCHDNMILIHRVIDAGSLFWVLVWTSQCWSRNVMELWSTWGLWRNSCQLWKDSQDKGGSHCHRCHLPYCHSVTGNITVSQGMSQCHRECYCTVMHFLYTCWAQPKV